MVLQPCVFVRVSASPCHPVRLLVSVLECQMLWGCVCLCVCHPVRLWVRWCQCQSVRCSGVVCVCACVTLSPCPSVGALVSVSECQMLGCCVCLCVCHPVALSVCGCVGVSVRVSDTRVLLQVARKSSPPPLTIGAEVTTPCTCYGLFIKLLFTPMCIIMCINPLHTTLYMPRFSSSSLLFRLHPDFSC